MSAPTTVRAATRRLVLLTALRWLPVGLTTPITVLLAQARGLTLGEVGLLFAVHGVVVITLELPTGGLADVFGRRPVMLAGAALHVLSCLVMLVATGFGHFLVAVLLLALGRTLDSGPLEAWYVDTVHVLDPGADVAPGLARHAAADGGGLAVGAVVGGLLPGLLGSGGADALALPYAVAAALGLVHVAAVVRLAAEVRPPRTVRARTALLDGLRAVPATVGGAVRLSVTDGPMRLVLLLTALGGAGLVACELLGPGRFAELAGGADDGAAVYGFVLAAAFALAAVASLAGTGLRRLLRGSTRAACAVLTVVSAAGLAVLAVADLLPAAAVGFAAYYVGHGAGWPLLSTVLHGRVSAQHRATAVSAMSLAVALGGMAGNLAVPAAVQLGGVDTAFLVIAAAVLLGTLACLRLPAGGPAQVPADAPGLPAGVGAVPAVSEGTAAAGTDEPQRPSPA